MKVVNWTSLLKRAATSHSFPALLVSYLTKFPWTCDRVVFSWPNLHWLYIQSYSFIFLIVFLEFELFVHYFWILLLIKSTSSHFNLFLMMYLSANKLNMIEASRLCWVLWKLPKQICMHLLCPRNSLRQMSLIKCFWLRRLA